MGTDINAVVEAKYDDGWTPLLKPIWPNFRYGEDGQPVFMPAPVIERHYALFSVLADVRNRTGRGVVTMMKQEFEEYGEVEFKYDTDDGGHDPLIPIATPRGIPDDACDIWKMFTAQAPIHDPTWLYLDELEDANWDQVIYEQAVVQEKEYLRYKETGDLPRMHARGVGGPGMRVVNEVEYEAGIRGEQTAVDMRWTGNTVRDDVSPAWWATIAVMRLVAPDDDPRKVRLLLAFDS